MRTPEPATSPKSGRNPHRRLPRRNPSRGAAAVEFALVLPLFVTLVMGSVDYGYFFFSEQVVANAAREGARAGTLIDPEGSVPSVTARSTAVSTATAWAQRYLTLNGVTCPGGGTSCISARYITVGASPGIEVSIQYNSQSLTGFTGVILPARVSAHSAMRWH
jgi:hypothetical protein